MRIAGNPLHWLRDLDADQIVSLELGVTRLEDLYRKLTGDPRAEDRVEATP